MKPLSVLNYYRNNVKKLMPVFIAVSLSVFLLYAVQMLVCSAFRTEYLAFVEPQKYYSSIRPIGRLLDPGLIESVKSNESAGSVFPFIFNYTNIMNTLGDDTGTKVLTMRSADIEALISKLGVRISEGRLPRPGSDEVLLHGLVARNKGLKIGDVFGNDIDKREFYPGRHTVSGLLDGSPIVSFDSLETWMKTNNIKDPYPFGLVIIPKDNGAVGLNKYLDSLPAGGMEVRTLSYVTARHNESVSSINTLLTVINIIIIGIVSLCAGFLCYIFFNQRRTEFGILNAIGYTRQQIINRAFAEVSGINGAGFAAGLLLALLAFVPFKQLIFTPRGQILVWWDAGYLMKVFCIPLFVTLFSLIPVWRMLEKLDPIAIIEGEG